MAVEGGDDAVEVFGRQCVVSIKARRDVFIEEAGRCPAYSRHRLGKPLSDEVRRDSHQAVRRGNCSVNVPMIGLHAAHEMLYHLR